MDSRLYEVFLTGKLADGVAREQAAERMAQLFKAAPATMLGLLTGKPQLLKRGVDRDTALRYREALQRAGIEVAFRPQANAAPAPQQETAAAPAPATAAPRVATAAAQPAPASPAGADGGLSLAPPGSDVLDPGERSHVEAVAIELGHLSVADVGAPLDELPRAGVPPVLPDLDRLTLRAAEGDLLEDDERAALPVAAPEVPDFTLAPAGADIETLRDDRPPVAVDIAGLSLAPEGTDLLTPDQRRKPEGTAPATDHLQLAP